MNFIKTLSNVLVLTTGISVTINVNRKAALTCEGIASKFNDLAGRFDAEADLLVGEREKKEAAAKKAAAEEADRTCRFCGSTRLNSKMSMDSSTGRVSYCTQCGEILGECPWREKHSWLVEEVPKEEESIEGEGINIDSVIGVVPPITESRELKDGTFVPKRDLAFIGTVAAKILLASVTAVAVVAAGWFAIKFLLIPSVLWLIVSLVYLVNLQIWSAFLAWAISSIYALLFGAAVAAVIRIVNIVAQVCMAD